MNLIFSESKRKLLGIAVSSLSWWKGEWIGLTLGVNIVPLLQNLLLFRRDEIIYHQFSNEVLYGNFNYFLLNNTL